MRFRIAVTAESRVLVLSSFLPAEMEPVLRLEALGDLVALLRRKCLAGAEPRKATRTAAVVTETPGGIGARGRLSPRLHGSPSCRVGVLSVW